MLHGVFDSDSAFALWLFGNVRFSIPVTGSKFFFKRNIPKNMLIKWKFILEKKREKTGYLLGKIFIHVNITHNMNN